jgi:selenocysteine-specific elongation factor
MVNRVRAHIRGNGNITLAQTRDLFGTSRKYAQALLEHLDETGVTRRVGDERVLR